MVESQPPSDMLKMSLPDTSALTGKIHETTTSENARSHADVTLISSDYIHIPALRTVLSISSSYFHKLFSSEFAEKNLSEVPVPVSSSLLHEILEFIYTDDCSLIRVIRNKMEESGDVACKEVRALVELAGAADYTRVERLVSRCEEGVTYMIKRFPHVACTTVRALGQGRSSWGKKLLQEAVNAIENDQGSLFPPYGGCDLNCGLMHLDVQSAEDVFANVKQKNAGHEKSFHLLFQALIVWATGGTALLLEWKCLPWTEGDIVVDTGIMKIWEERLEPAKRIATWFDLSGFNPTYLSEVVEKSGLVGHDRLCIAYKEQAIQLEELWHTRKGKRFN